MYLSLQGNGTPLRDIVALLGKTYDKIVGRCRYVDSDGNLADEQLGSKISMEDKFDTWEESCKDGCTVLTVWTSGKLIKL